jgi:hypothetical protein
MWRLHMAEWRILAEGMRIRADRQEKAHAEATEGRERPKGQERPSTTEMASEYADEIRLAKQGKHPDQQRAAGA